MYKTVPAIFILQNIDFDILCVVLATPKGKAVRSFYKRKLEKQYEGYKIRLFYDDESHVWKEGYVPFGLKFSGEEICILSGRKVRLNCFTSISRNRECLQFITQEKIDAPKIMEFLENFSFKICKETFPILDNAAVHRAKCIQERVRSWRKRGLYLFFYLSGYSPHLNITEIVQAKLKG